MFHRMLIRLFCQQEEGAAVVEYAAALLLVAGLIVAIVSILGGTLSGFFQSVAGTI